MNYQQMDQNLWVCYQLSPTSYYYGEVGYLDESGVVNSKDSTEASSNPKNKLVRHGFGVYIYNINSENEPIKYEGHWDRDRKHGQGKLTVPGQFTYEGAFKDGCYHQNGKMAWTNGDSYDGNWKKNRMDGGGIFCHRDGFSLKGSFKANYFVDESVLRNPQMNQKQYTLFKKQRKEVIKQKERNEKVKHGFVMKLKTTQLEQLNQICQQSNKNNRIPLILATEQSKISLKCITQICQKSSKCNCFDLRKAYLLEGQQKYSYKQQFISITRSTLKNNETLIINLDENSQNYSESFYPDLKQFYDPTGFNGNVWSRSQMKKKQISEKIIGSEELSEQYKIAVWSKLKYKQSITNQKLKEKLQMMLEGILPWIKIDIILIIKGQEPVVQQKEEPSSE